MNKKIKLIVCVLLFSIVTPAWSAEVGNIAPGEIDRVQTRVKSKNFRSIGFGPGRFQNLNTKNMAYTLSTAFVWDVRVDAALRLALDSAMLVDDGETTGMGSGSMGGIYYLSASDVSPLVLGELGLGGAGATKDADTIFGFVAGGGLGLALFRTSDTQLQILGQYRAMLKKNEFGVPAIMSFSLNLLW